MLAISGPGGLRFKSSLHGHLIFNEIQSSTRQELSWGSQSRSLPAVWQPIVSSLIAYSATSGAATSSVQAGKYVSMPGRWKVMGQVNIDSFLGLPEWLLTFLFLIAMAATCEIGFRLGLRARVEEKTKALVPMLAGSILAIMGLLLGFTMSMSVSRFDTRRRLVLEEASAIKTVYLRMQALPPPESSELQDLLRQYAASRLRVSQNALDIRLLEQGRNEDARLQREIWSRTVALAQKDPHSMPVALLMESLNKAFDVAGSRWISFVAHVPESVVYVNAVMGLVAILLVTYDFGMSRYRHALSTVIMVCSITMVMSLIVGLDRPHSGAIRVSQQPLIDLLHELAPPGH